MKKIRLGTIYLAKEMFERYLNPLADKYGVSVPSIEMLSILHKSKQDTAKDMMDALGFSSSLTSFYISQLIDAGFIIKERDTSDKRIYHLIITEAAQPIMEDLEEYKNKFFGAVYNGVSKEDMEVHKNVMRIMADNIEEMIKGNWS